MIFWADRQAAAQKYAKHMQMTAEAYSLERDGNVAQAREKYTNALAVKREALYDYQQVVEREQGGR